MSKEDNQTEDLGTYYNQPKFEYAREYVLRRYNYLEDRFIGTFRYIDPHPRNSYCFSPEFSSILVDSGRMFSSIMDAIYKGIEFSKIKQPKRDFDKVGKIEESQPNFTQFRKILLEKTYLINCQSVQFKLFNNKLIFPFTALDNEKGTPNWWEAFNKIKHIDIFHYPEGNFKNTLSSIAGVYLVAVFLSDNMLTQSKVFDYWGIGDGIKKSEVKERKFLFPDTE